MTGDDGINRTMIYQANDSPKLKRISYVVDLLKYTAALYMKKNQPGKRPMSSCLHESQEWNSINVFIEPRLTANHGDSHLLANERLMNKWLTTKRLMTHYRFNAAEENTVRRTAASIPSQAWCNDIMTMTSTCTTNHVLVMSSSSIGFILTCTQI